MRFYSDMEANHAVWDGNKMLEFANKVYETKDQQEIKLLIKAGYRYDQEKAEDKAEEETEKEAEVEAKPKRASR